MIDSKEDFENSLGVSFSDNHIPDDDPRPTAGCLIRFFLPFVLIVGLILVLIASCNTAKRSEEATTSTFAATTPSLSDLPTMHLGEFPTIDFSMFETTPSYETQSPETQPPATSPTIPPQKEPSLKFISYPKTVLRNEDATVIIQGKPYTKYSITVEYASGPSSASGLDAKYSNENGYVRWSWHVGGRTNPGTFTITVRGGGETKTVNFSVID